MQALNSTNYGPRGPHPDQLQRRLHPFIYHLSEKPSECDHQHTIWETGTCEIEIIDGMDIWVNSLIKQCAHIRKNPERHACICYKNTSKGDKYALVCKDGPVFNLNNLEW